MDILPQPNYAPVSTAVSSLATPLIFLDLDDVLCLNAPYGGRHVVGIPRPTDLWEKLFSKEASEVLLEICSEHQPRFVLTTSWLRMLKKIGFEQVFRATGLGTIADQLHTNWDAPQNRGMSRLQAIDHWLDQHHEGQPFVVLDDHFSGTGLAGSHIDANRRLVLCEVGVGLLFTHKAAIRLAFNVH